MRLEEIRRVRLEEMRDAKVLGRALLLPSRRSRGPMAFGRLFRILKPSESHLKAVQSCCGSRRSNSIRFRRRPPRPSQLCRRRRCQRTSCEIWATLGWAPSPRAPSPPSFERASRAHSGKSPSKRTPCARAAGERPEWRLRQSWQRLHACSCSSPLRTRALPSSSPSTDPPTVAASTSC